MQSFTCTALLGIPLGDLADFAHPAVTVSGRLFQIVTLALPSPTFKVPQPRKNKFSRFRLFRFRSPLLTESVRFLFLGLLRCFTSPRFALLDYEFIQQ